MCRTSGEASRTRYLRTLRRRTRVLIPKADLATTFISRSFRWLAPARQHRHRQPAKLAVSSHIQESSARRRCFKRPSHFASLAALGEEAFQSFGIRGPRTTLMRPSTLKLPPLTRQHAAHSERRHGAGLERIHLSQTRKPSLLRGEFGETSAAGPTLRQHLARKDQRRNPRCDCRRVGRCSDTVDERIKTVAHAMCGGNTNGRQRPRFVRRCSGSSPNDLGATWEWFQAAPSADCRVDWGLRASQVIYYEQGHGPLAECEVVHARIQGNLPPREKLESSVCSDGVGSTARCTRWV